ncbi:hypothetical protein [Desulfoluna butyratoxydans]|uniref:hypothetical protein n=1 Tax=Desulfoluna butyratoxydans TaxID=231438 RepID=UPI0015D424D6|nr:hypothetical protein [Desulfoluna butyratoxydans]
MNSIRKNIKEILDLISSKEEQIKYEKEVPIANVPAELICTWFDDLYHPQSKLHQEAFSDDEQQILDSFNTFYESRVGELPETLSEMHINLQWEEIIKEAQRVLRSITF